MAKRKPKKLTNELPEKFVERTKELFGSQIYESVRKTFVDKPTTFRVNTLKADRKEIEEVLQQKGFKTKRVSWYDDAFILENKSKRELTDLEIYSEGKIYIQSLASMIPPLVMNPQLGEKVFDITAAPGSKSSQIAALMQRNGELVANELNKVRFFRLEHNMRDQGVLNNPIDQNVWNFVLRMEDGSLLSKEYFEYFDKVLLDAPCGGEARFIEGVPKTYGYWNEKKIKRLAFRQQKLLLASWSTVKPGGLLVYSTCTMAPEENESRVSKLLERVGDEAVLEKIEFKGLKTIPALKEWRGREFHKDIQKTLRVMPTAEVEGFYIAAIRKKV